MAAPAERDVELAITTIKKGAQLLKYGRRGKPKFCPFKLANDESALIWLSGKEEKQLKLCHVSRIISGQLTPVFQRYPRPEKEHQSFSLICNDRSLDLICKDKAEAEVWITGLKSLISHSRLQRERAESKSEGISFETSSWGSHSQRNSSSSFTFGSGDSSQKDGVISPHLHPPNASSEKALSGITSYAVPPRVSSPSECSSTTINSRSPKGSDGITGLTKGINVEACRLSSSCSASHGSGDGETDALGDVYIWGEGTGEGILGGELYRFGSNGLRPDSLLPKPLESAASMDVQMIACGRGHAALLTKKGEVFSWGKELRGRLGHGIDNDVLCPKLINGLKGISVEHVACGEYHSCAVTSRGDLYIWGDTAYSFRKLENGNEPRQWVPKWLIGSLDGLHVLSVSCGPWHTAIVTSTGQLFTFGDGSFGVLGHGDCASVSIPREVEFLKGLRTVRAACGVWHTAAVVEVIVCSSSSSTGSPGKIFTWGDGDKARLGHGDKETRLLPTCVAALVESNFCQVACGHSLTVALTTTGQVYTIGSPIYGQLGNPESNGKLPSLVEDILATKFVKEVACGAHHVAVLTLGNEVYTWGKGANGQLGHGETSDRNCPSIVGLLKDKQVKVIACGTNFTAAICLHKWVSGVDQSFCAGCHLSFTFKRKRHNCYNCGLVFCHSCSSKKSLNASMAPPQDKPYRVCDKCFCKLREVNEMDHSSLPMLSRRDSICLGQSEVEKNENSSTISHELRRYYSLNLYNNADGGLFETRKGSFSHEVSPSGKDESSSLKNFKSSKRLSSFSVPVSRVGSRATSPKSRQSSPPHAIMTAKNLSVPPAVMDSVDHLNDGLDEEVINLRAQLEEFARKTQLQQIELERTTTQLKEAIEVAAEESAKYKAAKEALKSLAGQWKDMAQRLPVEATSSSNRPPNFLNMATSPDPRCASNEQLSSSTTGHGPDLKHSNGPKINHMSGTAGNQTSNHPAAHVRAKSTAKIEPTLGDEWVELYEPGVYITLASLSGGAKDLKRARFSRNWFTAKEAEQWWAANRSKVYQHYHIPMDEKSVDESEGKG